MATNPGRWCRDIAAAAEGGKMHVWDLIDSIFGGYIDIRIKQWMGMGGGRRWALQAEF